MPWKRLVEHILEGELAGDGKRVVLGGHQGHIERPRLHRVGRSGHHHFEADRQRRGNRPQVLHDLSVHVVDVERDAGHAFRVLVGQRDLEGIGDIGIAAACHILGVVDHADGLGEVLVVKRQQQKKDLLGFLRMHRLASGKRQTSAHGKISRRRDACQSVPLAMGV